MPCVRLLFGWFGLLLWLAVTGAALMVVGTHWQELTTNIIDRVLSVDNLLIMAVCYPLVKAAHELGHGYAAKAWGREVRSEEHTSELQSLMRISYAVFCLKKKKY